MTDKKKIADLQRVCAELYQVLGALADFGGCWCHPDVARAMDNASAAANGEGIRHKNLLPFPRYGLCRDRDVAAVKLAMKKLRRRKSK